MGQVATAGGLAGRFGDFVLAREAAGPRRIERQAGAVVDLPRARRRPVAAPVWVLSTYRVGDATQVMALAEALGLPFEVKTFALRSGCLVLAPPWSASLAGVDLTNSSPVEGPWPTIVISTGAENEPVARWIKKASGGVTKLVHVGRPWGNVSAYDLVVTTPQYRLRPAANVLENEAPLHRVTDDRLIAEGRRWWPRLAHLPRPFVSVLVGGNSGPYALGRDAGERLGRQASELVRSLGGSVLITTSKRTPASAIAGIASAIDVPHYLFGWKRGACDNPYYAFLELADEIVVTADSISMIAEACATGKPVHLFDLGNGPTSMRAPLGLRGEIGKPALRPRRWLDEFGLRSAIYRALMRHAPARITRDIRLVHRRLVAAGRAAWLGEPGGRPRGHAGLGDLDRAVSRVLALLGRADAEPHFERAA